MTTPQSNNKTGSTSTGDNSRNTRSGNNRSNNGRSGSSNTKKEEPKIILRGALKLDASTSTPIVTAGTEFSIYVVIRNPFQVPVTIYSTETHIPVELSDELWRKAQQKKTQQDRKKFLSTQLITSPNPFTHIQTGMRQLRYRIGFVFEDIVSYFKNDSGPRVAIAVTPETEVSITTSQAVPVLHFGNSQLGDIQINEVNGEKWQLQFDNMTEQDIRQILWDINEYRAGKQPIILWPGNSIVKHFVLKTNRWLVFTPISHVFHIQVRYNVDSYSNVDTIPFSLNIRSPMKSSLIAAVAGSVLGSIASRKAAFNDVLDIIQTLIVAIIFSIVVVVSFARKSNVQQIISIEDFWGGLFIGFLVGYSGETFVNSVIGIGANGASTPNP
jgi:hypothetical protein